MHQIMYMTIHQHMLRFRFDIQIMNYEVKFVSSIHVSNLKHPILNHGFVLVILKIKNIKQGTLQSDVHRNIRSRRRREHKLRRSSCTPSGTTFMDVCGNPVGYRVKSREIIGNLPITCYPKGIHQIRKCF